MSSRLFKPHLRGHPRQKMWFENTYRFPLFKPYPQNTSGWWFEALWKILSQLGWLFPTYGKIKNVPNHQPDTGVQWSRMSDSSHRAKFNTSSPTPGSWPQFNSPVFCVEKPTWKSPKGWIHETNWPFSRRISGHRKIHDENAELGNHGS